MTELKVVDQYPPASIGKRPLCCATLSRYVVDRNLEWVSRKDGPPNYLKRQIAKGHDATLCGNMARYKIEGEYYCRKHAALKALDLIAEKVTP
jgi:hypothetical protein